MLLNMKLNSKFIRASQHCETRFPDGGDGAGQAGANSFYGVCLHIL